MSFGVTFLDVGQGDSSLVDLPGGFFGVVDFGDGTAGAAIVGPAVQEKIDAGSKFLFGAITHFDDDHAGGLSNVLSVYEPKYFLLPGVNLDVIEQWARQLAQTAAVDGIAAMRATRTVTAIRMECRSEGVRFPEVPSVKFRALSPDHHVESELCELLSSAGTDPSEATSGLARMRNRGSLALYLDDGGTSAVLLGEVERDQYLYIWQLLNDWMKGEYREPVLVKLSHHGSRHNNPPELFQYFGSQGVLMVASAGGQHGHPDVTVMEQVQQSGATPACTNLGSGCHQLMGLARRPPDLVAWRESVARTLKKSPPGRPQCYGTVHVTLDKGAAQAEFSSVRTNCPFGGVAASAVRLAASSP